MMCCLRHKVDGVLYTAVVETLKHRHPYYSAGVAREKVSEGVTIRIIHMECCDFNCNS